jgi:RNA methyltransferase, TrmH family
MKRRRGAHDEKDAATEIIYGHRAALAVLEKRPDDVLRIACTPERAAEVARASRLRATTLPEREIEHIARSTHHEGLCLLTRPRSFLPPQALADRLASSGGIAVALDRVRNSYNLGAILRSAAFFGIDAALLGAPAPHPGLDPNAVRVAEGGVEHIALSRTTDLAETLSRLRARGVRVLGADGRAENDALSYAFGRPAILVLGNEREGLGARVRAQCDALVSVRGQGRIESLNVAVAAGILIAQLAHSSIDTPG